MAVSSPRSQPHPPQRRIAPPLDAAALERLALRYVERFATTRGRLADYLTRKIRERGWDDGAAPDAAALAQRLADLGYIDDRLYAESKAAALGRRGMGARRVAMALHAARIDPADAEALDPAIRAQAGAAAVAFARRRRIGPFGPPAEDRAARDRQLAAMVRAGHDFETARRIVTAQGEEELEELR